jgi:hypothetical protein
MYPVLKEDILKLLSDTEETRLGLEILKQDQVKWARNREQNDLAGFLIYLKRLETDVVKVLADWTRQTCRAKNKSQTSQVLDSLQYTFVKLNILFNDLKKVRTELNEAYIHSISIKQLEIDWDRFYKVIEQIQGYLLDGFFLREKDNISLSDEVQNDRFPTIH